MLGRSQVSSCSHGLSVREYTGTKCPHGTLAVSALYTHVLHTSSMYVCTCVCTLGLHTYMFACTQTPKPHMLFDPFFALHLIYPGENSGCEERFSKNTYNRKILETKHTLTKRRFVKFWFLPSEEYSPVI